MVQPYVFTTASLRHHDQYDAWCTWFRPLFNVTATGPTNRGFVAQNIVWQLGDLAMSRVSAPAVRASRTKANLIRDPADHWVLTYCRQGTTVIRINDAVLHVPAGVPFVWSLGQVFESERSAVDRVQLFLPRGVFRDIGPLLDDACGSMLDSPRGRLLGDFILALERRLPFLAGSDLPRLAGMARGMVIASVMPSARLRADSQHHVDTALLEWVRRTVRENIRSPAALEPASLCHHLSISLSDLHRLFKGMGGVARYVRLQRLVAACVEISDPQNRTSVADIAASYGWTDGVVAFGRAFRREFGHSPSVVRAAAIDRSAASARPWMRSGAVVTGFSDLLRGP